MFVARPQATPSAPADLHLIRAERRSFAGSVEVLRDRGRRAAVGRYITDMARPYSREVPPGLFEEPLSPKLGQSYGEMGAALVGAVVPADEPVDLLVLAFSVHDLWPGRATAAYLSHACPGSPMAFAICDQGAAAAFSGLRIARQYAASAGCLRSLLIVVEQAALPYDGAATLPSQHRGVAMLYSAASPDGGAGPGGGAGTGGGAGGGLGRVAGLCQHADVPADGVANLASAELARLSAGRRDVRLVLGDALAGVWPGRRGDRVRVAPAGQPSTGIWWELIGELSAELNGQPAADAGHPDLLVAADYDPGLRYLCLAAIEPA